MTDSQAGQVFFRYRDKTVAVVSSESNLLDQITELFPGYLVRSPSESSATFQVKRKKIGWLLVGLPAGDLSIATRSGLIDELEFAITVELLSAPPLAAYIHGSAVLVRPDEAILVLGKSGAGKSSLALHWCVNGLQVLGDDILRLEPSGKISAFQRMFEVDSRRFKKLGLDKNASPFWSSLSSEVWFDPRGYGGWASGAHGVARVLLVEKNVSEKMKLSEVGIEEALGWLSVSLMPEGLSAGECLDDLISLVKHARCFRASIQDPAKAAPTLVDF